MFKLTPGTLIPFLLPNIPPTNGIILLGILSKPLSICPTTKAATALIIPFVKNHLGNAKYLMRDEKGRILSYNKSLNLFKKYMEEHKLNVEHLPHDTRKTAVSLLHSAGIPMETIRVIVGHSGKGVTETVYLYKEPKELVEIVNKLEIPYARV